MGIGHGQVFPLYFQFYTVCNFVLCMLQIQCNFTQLCRLACLPGVDNAAGMMRLQMERVASPKGVTRAGPSHIL